MSGRGRTGGSAVQGAGIYAISTGLTGENLPKTLAKLNKVRAGSAHMRVDFAGDSTTGSADSSRLLSWSHAFAKSLNARDSRLPTSTDAWAGQMNQTTTAGVQALDSRIVFGAGWLVLNQFSYGGNIAYNSTTTNSLAFTPEKAWDTVEVEYLTNSSQGTMTLAADASVFATIDTSTPNFQLQKNTYTTGSAAAVQALNIARTGVGSTVYVVSVRCYNSATKQVLVCNAGSHSSLSSQWGSNGGLSYYGCLNRITKRAADLLVIALGVNDWNGATTVEAHVTNLTAMITPQLAVGGEVLLIGQPESNPATYATAARQAEFRAAQYALALATPGVAHLDIKPKFGDFAAANTNGYMTDDRHPSSVGSAMWGDVAAQALLAL